MFIDAKGRLFNSFVRTLPSSCTNEGKAGCPERAVCSWFHMCWIELRYDWVYYSMRAPSGSSLVVHIHNVIHLALTRRRATLYHMEILPLLLIPTPIMIEPIPKWLYSATLESWNRPCQRHNVARFISDNYWSPLIFCPIDAIFRSSQICLPVMSDPWDVNPCLTETITHCLALNDDTTWFLHVISEFGGSHEVMASYWDQE